MGYFVLKDVSKPCWLKYGLTGIGRSPFKIKDHYSMEIPFGVSHNESVFFHIKSSSFPRKHITKAIQGQKLECRTLHQQLKEKTKMNPGSYQRLNKGSNSFNAIPL
jgi:hypothetical protein